MQGLRASRSRVAVQRSVSTRLRGGQRSAPRPTASLNRNEKRPITLVWMDSLCPSGKRCSSCYATLKEVPNVIELEKALLFAAVFVFAVMGIGAAVAVLCIATDGRAANVSAGRR